MGSGLAGNLHATLLGILDQLNILTEGNVANVDVFVVQHSKHENSTKVATCCVYAERVVAWPVHHVFFPQSKVIIHDERSESVCRQRVSPHNMVEGNSRE